MFLIISCVPACSTVRTQPIKTPEGFASDGTLEDEQAINEAKAVAEIYWNAQKKSDSQVFSSVTPHPLMTVVFDWSFVNQSGIYFEEASIDKIKEHLKQCLFYWNKYETSPDLSNEASSNLGIASNYAKKIEIRYPMIGNLLQRAYWRAVIPPNIDELTNYRLMRYNFTADVKLQSRAGTLLLKRKNTELYRMVADNFDSGWKVLFVF